MSLPEPCAWAICEEVRELVLVMAVAIIIFVRILAFLLLERVVDVLTANLLAFTAHPVLQFSNRIGGTILPKVPPFPAARRKS
jgi:hypothetical protein